MITAKSAKKKMKSLKNAAVEQISHITTNEKIAGAAAIGVAVGVAATALGSSLLHGGETATKTAKTDSKAPAAKG
jgi:ABC-type tungstate transport system substrate-binding protein